MATMIQSAGGREMTVGGVLSRGFVAVGAAPVTFFGTSFLLVALPSSLIGLAVRTSMLPSAPGINPFARLWPVLVGTILVWWLLYMATQALLIRAAVTELDGQAETLGSSVAAAVRSLLPLVGLSIVLSLAVWMGMILLIVPGVILAILWSVAAPVLVAERSGVFTAMSRSRRLTSGARWRIFGLVMLVFAIYWIASVTVGVGNVAMNGLAAARASASPPVISTILSLVVQTAFVAVWTAIQAALYVELRDWKDGPTGDRLADVFA